MLTLYDISIIIFNIFVGFAGIAWFIAWLFLVSNTPAEHPRISPKEIEYIESTIQAEILTRKATPKVIHANIMPTCILINRDHLLGSTFLHHQQLLQ